MAKKHEYPQNTSWQARNEAILRGFQSCRNSLKNIRDIVCELLPKDVATAVCRNIDDALADADLASRALMGDD